MVGRNGQIGSIKSWGGVSSGNGQWTRLAKEDGLEPLQGHGIGIGATLFYLLQGVAIEATIKIMGKMERRHFLAIFTEALPEL